MSQIPVEARIVVQFSCGAASASMPSQVQHSGLPTTAQRG